MKSSKKDKERQYKITVRATEEERDVIQEKAIQSKNSISGFLIEAALASETSCKKDAFLQAQRLIKLQRMIDDIEDQTVQAKLRKESENVWHSFASLTKVTNTETAAH